MRNEIIQETPITNIRSGKGHIMTYPRVVSKAIFSIIDNFMSRNSTTLCQMNEYIEKTTYQN